MHDSDEYGANVNVHVSMATVWTWSCSFLELIDWLRSLKTIEWVLCHLRTFMCGPR